MIIRGLIALLALGLFSYSLTAGSWTLGAVSVILLCVAAIPRRVTRRPVPLDAEVPKIVMVIDEGA